MTGLLQRILGRHADGPRPQQLPAEPPAGRDPRDVPAPAPGFRERGRLRRRLRYLRRLREIGFRDLGGLVFDLDRFGRERADLVRAKLDALRAADAELRALESALGDGRDVEEIHEPGLATCARCGELHGSEARFCPACGTAVAGAVPADGDDPDGDTTAAGDGVTTALAPVPAPPPAGADAPRP